MENLFDLCPIESSNGTFRINNRHQDAVIALGVYLLESGFQHVDKILPYLLRLAKSLNKAVWINEIKLNNCDRIPTAERFSFCLHTLLSDIASRCPCMQPEIITAQINCLNTLTTSIKSLQEQPQNSSNTKLYLCKSTVPTLIGLARAMGRFSTTEPPLICRIFPRPEPPAAQQQIPTTEKTNYKRSFSSFRSIIPRSLSGNLTATLDILAITQIKVISTSTN